MDQTHQKWLEWRRGGIGSSDAATLMDASPWKTRYDLYKEKVFGEVTQEDNDAMKHGRDKEPMVREWLQERFEMFLEPRNIENPVYHWSRASLDAISFCGRHIFEIKCPYKNAKDHAMARSGKVPEKYFPQLQHQMLVTDLRKIGYISFFEGHFADPIFINRDDEYVERLFKAEICFWNDNVLARVAPPLTDRDTRDMDHKNSWQLHAAERNKYKKILDEAEELEEFHRKKLIELANGKNSKGCGVKVTSSECEGRIDYEKALIEYQTKIMQNYPHIELLDFDVEDYRKPSTIKYRLSMY